MGKAHEQAKELMVVLRELIHGIRPQTNRRVLAVLAYLRSTG